MKVRLTTGIDAIAIASQRSVAFEHTACAERRREIRSPSLWIARGREPVGREQCIRGSSHWGVCPLSPPKLFTPAAPPTASPVCGPHLKAGAGGRWRLVAQADGTWGRGHGLEARPSRRGPCQPGLKVRRPEYHRISNGPDYTASFDVLSEHHLGKKRQLAQREHGLGLVEPSGKPVLRRGSARRLTL